MAADGERTFLASTFLSNWKTMFAPGVARYQSLSQSSGLLKPFPVPFFLWGVSRNLPQRVRQITKLLPLILLFIFGSAIEFAGAERN